MNSIPRISRATLYMEIAKLMAKRATCGRGQVGAVLVKDYRVIASGYNGPPQGQPHCSDGVCDLSKPCTHAVHAEANLIAFCAKFGIPVNGSTLVLTTVPCRKCAELIIQAGIKAVVYDSEYRSEEGFELLKSAGITIIQYNPELKIPNEIFL